MWRLDTRRPETVIQVRGGAVIRPGQAAQAFDDQAVTTVLVVGDTIVALVSRMTGSIERSGRHGRDGTLSTWRQGELQRRTALPSAPAFCKAVVLCLLET